MKHPKRNFVKNTLVLSVLSLITASKLFAQTNISFRVDLKQRNEHLFNVSMRLTNAGLKPLVLKMPAWTPGYYQELNFADMVLDIQAMDGAGKKVSLTKVGRNGWRLPANAGRSITIQYKVKAERSFVANPFIDSSHAYIIPAGVFLYPDGMLLNRVTVDIDPGPWHQISTGLEADTKTRNRFTAVDYDVLYDSPLLIGPLDSLPTFYVNNIPHRFQGYQLGKFDKNQLSSDLQKVCAAAVDVIHDIPFSHYTFIGIGPGRGGIEHLNSTTISFHENGNLSAESRLRTLHFIAHEYFHHYNVKRIRPVELGPFDYDKGTRTNLLWVSEGLSVYYEYMVVKRAGLSSEDEVFKAFQGNIRAYELQPGRLFQSLTQASYETWSDGPFGRTGDEINKTISYYDKGPVVGLMLDFAIRHHSNNNKSLDDVMRSVYQKYYQQLKRGFTEAEFQSACEEEAGVPLTELFEYTNTVKPLDYKKYFAYGGLDIDTAHVALHQNYTGIHTRWRNDSLFVSQVDWQSPAWDSWVRAGQVVIEANGKPVTRNSIDSLTNATRIGDNLSLRLKTSKQILNTTVTVGRKLEASYSISRLAKPDALQSQILEDWLK